MRMEITMEQFGELNPEMRTKCQVCGRRYGLHYPVYIGKQRDPSRTECPIVRLETRLANINQ